MLTAITVITLAVGIGANAAVFSVLDSVLIRPLPFPDSDRLVWLNFTAPGFDFEEMPFSESVYMFVREEEHAFDNIALFRGIGVTVQGEREPLRVEAAEVTPDFFQVLGAPPALGRGFVPDDGRPGSEPVAVLSHELWSSQFGGDPGVLGSIVRMDGVARRVVGVMPQGFAIPGSQDQIWVPLIIDPANPSRGNFAYPAIGRLSPGETPVSAHADLSRLVPRIGEVVPDLTPDVVAEARFAPVVRPLQERLVADVHRLLFVVFGTGSLLLLIACANVATLLAVRAERRGREFAVRSALGAGRRHIAGLVVSEGLVLAAIGGALGMAFAWFGVELITGMVPARLPAVREIGLNGHVLLFTTALTLSAGLVVGGIPLLRRTRHEASVALKESGSSSATSGRDAGRVRSGLVIIQVALSLVLLIGAGLMLRTFDAIRSVDPGFRPDGVLTFGVALPTVDYPTDASAAIFWGELVQRIESLPGVRSATVASGIPLGGGIASGTILVEDNPIPPGDLPPLAERKFVTPGYFETLGIALDKGRWLNARDAADGFPAVVVNRTFADRLWPGGEALGKRIREAPSDPWYEIVGVVADTRFQTLQERPDAEVYFPVAAGPADSPRTPRHMAVAVSTTGNPVSLMSAIREQVWSLDPRLSINDPRTLRAIINDSMAVTSFVLVMLGGAAGIALLLGVIGIYGVISFLVEQRRREIGLRIALGATRRAVAGMIVRQAMTLTAFGVVLGLIGSAALSRLLEALLYAVSATDPLTYATVAVLLLGVAVFASYVPARRASAIEPKESLTGE